MQKKTQLQGRGLVYGYTRVSSGSQKEDRQMIKLRGLCDEIIVEKISADSDERPKFEGLLARLESGDTLYVLDLDRAFRDMMHATITLSDLLDRGIHFKIFNSHLDLTSNIGRLIYVLQAYFAEEELATIRRRTREGLAAARLRGVRLGRPFALNDAQICRAYQIMQETGLPLYKVAKRFAVSHSTLALSFDRLGLQ